MLGKTSTFIWMIAIGTAVGFACQTASAGTILKLNLDGVGPDIQLDSAGILSTFNDGDGTTTGDQNTAIEFTDFLNGNPDINTSTASVTIDGLAVSGPAFVNLGIAYQPFANGIVRIYGPAPGNTLLLQGQLGGSILVGTIGPPGNGGFFTTTFANVTGGTLDSAIGDNTLTMQMTLSNINNGAGLFVGGPGLAISPFRADTAITMAADPVPEPTAFVLVMLGGAIAAATPKRCR